MNPLEKLPPVNINTHVEPENSCNCRCPSNCCLTRKVKHDKDCAHHHVSKKTDAVAKGAFRR